VVDHLGQGFIQGASVEAIDQVIGAGAQDIEGVDDGAGAAQVMGGSFERICGHIGSSLAIRRGSCRGLTANVDGLRVTIAQRVARQAITAIASAISHHQELLRLADDLAPLTAL